MLFLIYNLAGWQCLSLLQTKKPKDVRPAGINKRSNKMDFIELQQNIARLELPNINLEITSSIEKSRIGRVLGIMLHKIVVIAIMFGINFEDVAH